MKIETFIDYWNKWSSVWIDNAQCYCVDQPDIIYNVKDKCRIPYTSATKVYQAYQQLKARVKGAYFTTDNIKNIDDIKLSRYKRAAVLIEAILITDCIDPFDKNESDALFLKERLAFFMGIVSIIQSLSSSEAQNLSKSKGKSIYQFDELDIDRKDGADDFLQSMYKDLFFSRIIGNYNVLTMANLLGVLTERASILYELINSKKDNNIHE